MLILLYSLFVNVAFAGISSIQADQFFTEMRANLDNSKTLIVYLQATVADSIVGVSNCTLQKKQNNVWTNAGSLPVTSPSENDDGTLSGAVDYSNYIDETGTYRIMVRIYMIHDSRYIYSRYIYSNQKTY